MPRLNDVVQNVFVPYVKKDDPVLRPHFTILNAVVVREDESYFKQDAIVFTVRCEKMFTPDGSSVPTDIAKFSLGVTDGRMSIVDFFVHNADETITYVALNQLQLRNGNTFWDLVDVTPEQKK